MAKQEQTDAGAETTLEKPVSATQQSVQGPIGHPLDDDSAVFDDTPVRNQQWFVRLTERWHTSLAALFEALRAMIGRAVLVAIPLTVASFAINYAQGWVVARALGIELSYLDVASLLATTSLLGLMPISVSGVGVRELFLALVFPALGLPAAQGVAFGLLVFVCNYLAIVFAGFVAWQVAPPPFEAGRVDPG